MYLNRIISSLVIALFISGAYAQESSKIKVTDIHNETIVLTTVSSSSSSSCNSSDFPVLKGGSYKDINFNELSRIIVHHDLPTDDSNYISIELIAKNGQAEKSEMIRFIRFTGHTDQKPFSIKVEDIKTVEVL